MKTLIIGGGLAGVSTAYHLNSHPYLLTEKASELGGTARSFKVGDFTFDFTGHLLHLHNPYTKKLITRLLKNNFFSCTRNAKIFSHRTYTRFPYQANTFGLPDAVINKVVLGFLEAHFDRQKNKKDFASMNFKDWCLFIFGRGISEEFMLPYNRKLYQVPPETMTVDWCGAFVPQVKVEDVIKGALVDQKKDFGYNVKFLYPKKGGIQALAQALGNNLKNVSLQTSVSAVNWKKKIATLSDGQTVKYSQMVNTIPLKDFLNLFSDLPAAVKNAQDQLKSVGILCLNVGIKRPKISDASWIYFPEDRYPFYRVGFPMNFTPHVVPKGCSSMYIEVPMELTRQLSTADLLRSVKNGLIEARILKESDEWMVTQFLPIPTAYVIYDHNRSAALKTIFNFLEKNKIQSIGRYGAWKYSFMEEAILDGKKAAEKIIGHKN